MVNKKELPLKGGSSFLSNILISLMQAVDIPTDLPALE
jgi:hypothetical protein